MPDSASRRMPDLPNASMNADHALEARLMNDVEVALGAHGRGESTLDAVMERLSVLAVHTREHFVREETMMREGRFPEYRTHKAEHDQVLADMDTEARAFRASGDAARLRRYLHEVLPALFADHIRRMDAVTAGNAAERGK